MKVVTPLILGLSISLLSGCNDKPTAPDIQGVTKEIDETGGTITLGDVTVEIPAGAISGEATLTLKTLDYNLEDSLDVKLSNEAMTIIIDGATVTDSIYVILPPFITDSELNVVGLKINGIWHPLEIIEEDISHIKVCIPIEIFDLELSNRPLLNSNMSITSMTVAAIEPLIKLPKSISLTQISYDKPSGPAIVLIHGIFSDNTHWKDDFINDYLKHVGDVYELEYPWTLHYMDIAQDVIDTLVQRLGGRTIYFVCHSKGGLVARAIIRLNETNNYGLLIDKALYFATPHFGAAIALIDAMCDHIYGPIARLINPNIKASEGIMELSPYSSELYEINQPLFFENSTPKYKCIIGDLKVCFVPPCIGNCGDCIVLGSSADLASSEHFGERENAIYYNALPVGLAHWEITDYPEQIWPDIESFFGSENPSNGFVLIPPGTFTMGSPTDEPGRSSNETMHQVTLTRGYYMSKYEVTEEWWNEVMGGAPTTSQYPKNYVSWDMAVEFCNALSIQEGLTPAYTINGPDGDVTWNRSANGYRLPTEAEWEYACRAATTMAFNNNTNCLSSNTEANYDGNYPLTGCPAGIYRPARTEVGTFPKNNWDLYDMHGNMWEWVWDGYRSDYENLGSVDPVYNVGPGAYRVGRGGSWGGSAGGCRSAGRGCNLPGGTNGYGGLRPVRSAD